MSTKDNYPSLLSKMAKFVRNPTTNWTDLDKQDPEPDAGYSKQALKEMIERKRQNDFVRRREFDQVRKLRSRDPGAGPDLAGRPSYFQSSLPSNPNERAMTIKKIDEIEAQMSNQWWQGKGDDPQKSGAANLAAPVGATKMTAELDKSTVDSAYAPTRMSPMRPEPLLSGGETSDFLPTQDSSEFESAHPAAEAPATAPRSAGTPLATRDTPAGDIRGRAQSRPFAVEPTSIATDTELEEAAIRFANGDDAGAESGLRDALQDDGANRLQAMAWTLALLDLYRATGQQASFEVAAIEFARRFGRSAPLWFSMPDMLGRKSSSAIVRTIPSRLMVEPIWCCPARLTLSSVDDMRLAIANVAGPWLLDWSGLAAIEPGAIEALGTLFAEWCATPVELFFAGTLELDAALRNCAPSGERSIPVANWKLRLDAMRIMGLQDEFELVALDYCVTYEVSPPPWEDTRCTFKRENSNGFDAGNGESGSIQDNSLDQAQAELRPVATVQMGLESLQAAVAELSGEIAGEATEALNRLEDTRNGSNQLVVSCANLVRVDFSAAGSILNWAATRQSEGCKVQFRDLHRLVAAFFCVIGINDHARVVMRTS